MSTERIYIGGLRPPHLTAGDLLGRLQKSLGSVLEIDADDRSAKEAACFLHVAAKLKKNDDDDSNNKTALEHIAKLYHNVTWKGCRLRVEPAKPHFLQRLQQEIQERKQTTTTTCANIIKDSDESQTEEPTHNPATTSIPPVPSKNARRHLKIRQRYGEQVFSVDTKPYAVESWRGMQALLRKIERRKRHYQQELKNNSLTHKKNSKKNNNNTANIRTQAKLNRAVHLRFTIHQQQQKESSDKDARQVASTAKIRDESDQSSSSSSSSVVSTSSSSPSSSSSDDSDTDDSSVEQQENDNHLKTTGTNSSTAKLSNYVWSSSSSSSSVSGDDESESQNDNDDDDDNDGSASDNDEEDIDKDGTRATEPPEESNTKPETNNKSSSYAWSSSSSEDEYEDDADQDTKNDKVEDMTKMETSRQQQDAKKIASSEHESEGTSEDESSSASSNEESEGSQPINGNNKQHHSPRLPSQFDEFESAMPTAKGDTDSDNDGSDIDIKNHDPESMQQDESGNLLQDVESNLSVLASLFPDMKKTQPRKVASAENDDAQGNAAAATQSKKGWSAGGIMLRYDPRNDTSTTTTKTNIEAKESEKDKQESDNTASSETSAEEEVTSEDEVTSEEDEIPDKERKDSSSEDSSAESDSEAPENESESENDDPREKKNPAAAAAAINESRGPAATSEGDIYKQAKLEDLFREAREGVSSTSSVKPTPGATSGTAGGFSFGFDLGTDEPVKPPAASACFSFSFFPSSEPETNNQEAKGESKVDTDEEGKKVAEPADSAAAEELNQPKQQPPTFRRRGMLLPKKVIDQYQEDFYVMGDGLKILQDLERYHKDPEVKAHWKQERQSLTLDWKRKRRHAVEARSKHQRSYKQQRR
ncbi:expressed unknown protein [Seminavis robusta]|uniref:Uncharacterized protein n=1 Tax=Seminavis robusta TaxID=568900 RepID=A0A9N8DEG5_9STRA|nr:expressed unknown protein [Seminavis robusta]|eukprot:Sro84_g045040.1 n/a (875) ;mRNA; r:108120-110744